MSTGVLILGESGTGKSTSMRNLNPEETFIIRVIDKPLPFKGWKNKYLNEDMIRSKVSDSTDKIVSWMNQISEKKPEIKTIIIDDAQYLMSNEFMRKSSEKGYDKFTDIAKHFWDVMNASGKLRDDLVVVVMSHTEMDEYGKMKIKTVGKLTDKMITPEGLFTIVLFTEVEDGNYYFITQNNGNNTAKSPLGMFEEAKIDNDLAVVIETLKKYNEED